jgi:SAM-dependent methyltransferase
MATGDENLKMIYPDFHLETYLIHLNHYKFADMMLPKNITVYDMGCGTGYGSCIVGRTRKYIGIDKNYDSIKYAREKYGTINFICEDILEYIKRHKNIRNVVMLEVLEHLNKEDGKELLQYINTKCNRFIVTVPKDSLLGTNKFHNSQWNTDEIKKQLGLFDVFNEFGQDWSSGVISYPFSHQVSIYVLYCYKVKSKVSC